MSKAITLPLRERVQALQKTVRGETVEVPEWGCSVIVRGLTAAEVQAMFGADTDTEAESPPTWVIAQRYCVDEQGNQAFNESDAEWLQHEPARALLRIAQAYNRLNTLTESAVEDAVKN